MGPFQERCKYIISTNYDHPVRPQKMYATPEVQNCQGKCKFFKDKQDGMQRKTDLETDELVEKVKADLEEHGAVVSMPSGNNDSHSVMVVRFPDGQAWHIARVIGPNKYQCNFALCDHGMGLAGEGGCPGDPQDRDCDEFASEFSDPPDGTLLMDDPRCKKKAGG